MVSAVFDRVFFFFFVRRQSHQSRFFPLSFSLLDDDSLVFATKALPSTFGITLSSHSRKKTRERETPRRRRRRPEEDEKTASQMFLVVVSSSGVITRSSVVFFSRHRCHLIHRRRFERNERDTIQSKNKRLGPKRYYSSARRRKRRPTQRKRERERERTKDRKRSAKLWLFLLLLTMMILHKQIHKSAFYY